MHHSQVSMVTFVTIMICPPMFFFYLEIDNKVNFTSNAEFKLFVQKFMYLPASLYTHEYITS